MVTGDRRELASSHSSGDLGSVRGCLSWGIEVTSPARGRLTGVASPAGAAVEMECKEGGAGLRVVGGAVAQQDARSDHAAGRADKKMRIQGFEMATASVATAMSGSRLRLS